MKRRSHLWRLLSIFGLLGVIALLVTMTGTQGSIAKQAAQTQAAANDGTVVSDVSVANAQVWTAAAMAAAQPYPVPEQSGAASATSAASGPTGDPGFSPGAAPQGQAAAESPAIQYAGGGIDPQSSTYPSPFTRYMYLGRYRTYPVSPIGKLFFTQNGSNYVCSAASAGLNKVWTAGHCVNDGATHWSTNVLFCPSYDSSQGGVNPAVGCWSGIQLGTSSAWYFNRDFDADYGVIRTAASGTLFNTSIGNVTGWLGFAWNWPRDLHYMAFGYPAAAPFTGGKLITCAAEFSFATSGGASTPDSQSIGCDMTGGSSGGPWVWQFGSGNYINGHNDWKWNSQPLHMNSPYFGDTARAVFVLFP